MSINVRRLKEIIIEKGLSCSELAAITGVSKAQIYRLLKGEVEKTTLKTISKISKGLGIAYTDIVKED